MASTLSEFHYSTLFIEGSAFADAERFHDEIAFKLGLLTHILDRQQEPRDLIDRKRPSSWLRSRQHG